MQKILNVKPISQLFPIPMIMGCEGACAAMILQYNNLPIKATHIMKHLPKHPNNPNKGYVGNHLFIKPRGHQTIFPNAIVPYLKQYSENIKNSTGNALHTLTKILDKGQPVVLYHTVLGQKPMTRTFKVDMKLINFVSNIHTTVLVGYDKDYYYYIDPLWSHIGSILILPAFIPNRFQIFKIKKNKLEKSYNAPGQMSFYLDK